MTTSRTAASARPRALVTLLTGLVGVVAGAALAFGPAVGSDADIVGAPLDLPACVGAVRTNGCTMQAKECVCLYDALAMLREEPRGRPEQHRRADTPCQRG